LQNCYDLLVAELSCFHLIPPRYFTRQDQSYGWT
jgi:hypothetical protein